MRRNRVTMSRRLGTSFEIGSPAPQIMNRSMERKHRWLVGLRTAPGQTLSESCACEQPGVGSAEGLQGPPWMHTGGEGKLGTGR